MINSVQLEGLTYMTSLEAQKAAVTEGSEEFLKVLNKTIEDDEVQQSSESAAGSTVYTNPEDLSSVAVPESMEAYFTEAEETYGVPAALLKAVAKAESNFDAEAVSSAGAQGVMQLMPSTAAGLGVQDCFDARENILGGAKYLSQLLTKYDGSVKLALAAYNAGSGNVSKYGGVPPFTETQNYVKRIFKYLGVDVNGNANTVVEEKGEDVVSSSKDGSTSTSNSAIDSSTAQQIADTLISSVTGSGTTQSTDSSSLYSNLLSSLSGSSSYLNLLNQSNLE